MIRSSINLSGILVILLAVTSAFITSRDGGVLKYKWYANTTGIISPTPAQLDAGGTFLSSSTSTGEPVTHMTQQQLNNYKAEHCVSPTTPICVAVIKYNDGIPIELLFVLNKTWIETFD